MSKYKDADAIHEKYDRYANHNPFGRGHGKTLARFLDWIDQEPNADVVEVLHGKWEECEIVQEDGDYKIIEEWQSARCSVCGKYHTTPYMYHFDHFNYCPNCGAKMERREDAN